MTAPTTPLTGRVWLDRVTVCWADDHGPVTEHRIGELLGPAVRQLPDTDLVVDARPATTRDGLTATYRLLAALDRPSAAPVCLSFTRPRDALDVLASVLAGLGGGPALLVTATASSPPHLVGCCLAGLGHGEGEPAAPPPVTGDPFGDLMWHHAERTD